MSGAAGDLIAGYLAELAAGLRVPPAEAELILAEAEDHLRETAAARLAAGMTEAEAQQAAVASFGPARAVARAHRRPVTAGHAAMAVWKLAALLATTIGGGGLATVFLLHTNPAWTDGVQEVPVSCCSVSIPVMMSPVAIALPYEAMAAGGLVLLATRWLAARRLARRGSSGRGPLPSAALTASFFLLVSVLLLAVKASGLGPTPRYESWIAPMSVGSGSTGPLVPDAVVAGCLAVAVGYGLTAALRRPAYPGYNRAR